MLDFHYFIFFSVFSREINQMVKGHKMEAARNSEFTSSLFYTSVKDMLLCSCYAIHIVNGYTYTEIKKMYIFKN